MPGPALHRQQQDELKAIQYLRQELAIWLSAEELKSLRKELDLALALLKPLPPVATPSRERRLRARWKRSPDTRKPVAGLKSWAEAA